MSKRKLPLSLLMIRGAVGKSFVVKHYKFGTFITKYPDMTRITASKKQRICRNLFKEAVAWAKTVIADKDRTKEWQKRLKRTKRVYNAAIKEYMAREKKKLQQARQIQSINQEKNLQPMNPPILKLTGRSNAEIKFFPIRITSTVVHKVKFFAAAGVPNSFTSHSPPTASAAWSLTNGAKQLESSLIFN